MQPEAAAAWMRAVSPPLWGYYPTWGYYPWISSPILCRMTGVTLPHTVILHGIGDNILRSTRPGATKHTLLRQQRRRETLPRHPHVAGIPLHAPPRGDKEHAHARTQGSSAVAGILAHAPLKGDRELTPTRVQLREFHNQNRDCIIKIDQIRCRT